jgi:hypothetical protein
MASTTEDEIGSAKPDRRRKPSAAKLENLKTDSSEGELIFFSCYNTIVLGQTIKILFNLGFLNFFQFVLFSYRISFCVSCLKLSI